MEIIDSTYDVVSPTEQQIDELAFIMVLRVLGEVPSVRQWEETKVFIRDFFENHPGSDKIIWLWERRCALNNEIIQDLV